MTVGISYPLRISPGGSLRLSTGLKLTEEHILSVLETKVGERVMRREYGLEDLIFSSTSPDLIDSSIEKSLFLSDKTLSECRVVGDASEYSSEGVYRVSISYDDRELNLGLNNG